MVDHDLIRAQDAELVRRLRGLHPSLIDFSTGRVERLLAALGSPQEKLAPVIHVAGTNGKGSTCAFLRSIAEAAGLKVHVLTSPHLVRFVERIRVSGELITEERLAVLIDKAEFANDGQPISFHEMSTAIALLAFSEAAADLCIVEVGLGGRFDCTNVFASPAVTVITPVDYDHLDKLGPELAKIAWEKAGIIKRGRPCVVAQQQEEARTVIEAEAQLLGAPLIRMGLEAETLCRHGRLVVRVGGRELDLSTPSLFGQHQFDNAGLAVAAILQLKDPRIDDVAIRDGVSHAVWPARFQELTHGPLGRDAALAGVRLFLDGGHNPHGGRALAQAVHQLVDQDPRPVALIVGMYARKDAQGFFEPFQSIGARVFSVSFDAPGAADPGDLAAIARGVGLAASPFNSVEAATEAAIEGSTSPPHIVICGGLHFAGEILSRDPETWPS